MRSLGYPLYVNGRLLEEPVTISHVPTGAVDPSMGALGAYVGYQPTLGAEVAPVPPVSPPRSPLLEIAKQAYKGVAVASTAALAYHGYKRNESIGWSLMWAIFGGGFPILGWPIAIAQGFGQRRSMTPNRSRRRRARKQKKNTAKDEEDRQFVYFDADEVAAGVPDGHRWDWNYIDIGEALDSAPASSRQQIEQMRVNDWLGLPGGAEIWRKR